MNIHIKLQQCRVDLQEMKLKKSGKNKFAGFEYFELQDFLPAVNSLFLKHKLFSLFSIDKEMAKLSIYDAEDDNASVVFETPVVNVELKGCTAIQGIGAMHSYAKRYLYLNALEIVESDMLDPNVGNNGSLEEVKKDDTDIYLGLEAIDNTANALKYFREYESKVNDKEAFKKAYKKRYLVLKKKENELW